MNININFKHAYVKCTLARITILWSHTGLGSTVNSKQ
jgi:hypothetical protein